MKEQFARQGARSWLRVAALTITLATPAAHALVKGERTRTCDNGHTYSDYYGGTITGDLGNFFAPFRIVIPDQGWNGKLLAYARGTGTSIKVNDQGIPIDVDGNADPYTQTPMLGFTPLDQPPARNHLNGSRSARKS